jgi:predicted phosphodiesterase
VRYLILSDIHANWEALEAVLAHAESKYDKIVCCGDLVGYGADPDPVTEWVRKNVATVVRGNHDKACAGLEDLEWFNPIARESVVWTQSVMKPENLGYLRDLVQGPEQVNGFQILHGSPLDEDEYVVTERDVAQIAPYLESALSFFGHTHLQGAFLCHRNGVKRLTDAIEIQNDTNYLINAGSVGQPRDHDPRAGYAIYDSESRLVTLLRVDYDIAEAQRKILKAGLPQQLAFRLMAGV